MAGLASFLGFGKSKKANAVPDVQYPIAGNQHFTNLDASRGGYNIRDFAAGRIKGENLGFGDNGEFLSKTANPAIANLENSFQRSTLPRLSSEASKRGIARSSIVTDQIGQAEREKNLDVNELVSKFYMLNEAQKKKDQTEGLNLAQDLNDQEVGMQTNSAAASERIRDINVNQANLANTQSRNRQNQVLQAAGQLTSDFFGSDPGQGLLNKLGLGNLVQSNTTKTNVLGSKDKMELMRMLLED